MDFTYASLYSSDRRTRSPFSSNLKSLILAPGQRLLRLGVGGCPVPCGSIPACDLPLTPAGAAASSLVLAAAQYVGLTRVELQAHSLFVAQPTVAFGPTAKRSLKHAALSLLNMRQIVFVDTHVAVALTARVDHTPHLIVDVGWASTRVLVNGLVVSAGD